jgi:N-dimethylarginine dimethylaminohydrolase
MDAINRHVLMSGAEFFATDYAINPYMKATAKIDLKKAQAEHAQIRQAMTEAGIHVIEVPPPEGCQDGVYTANWGLVRGNKVLLSSLPIGRQDEMPYARQILSDLGKKVIMAPHPFSGQGDALACDDLVFVGSGYRTDKRMHQLIADSLGYQVVSLQTLPHLAASQPAKNPITGRPDGFFYDLDLALAILSPKLIAWCPEAFTAASQAKLRALKLDKIEVSLTEAMEGFACNLVSTGQTVVMSARAPRLQAAIEDHGLRTIRPFITELAKGGGYIRCVSLTLD